MKFIKNKQIYLDAYDLTLKYQNEGINRQDIVNIIHQRFGISTGTVYSWLSRKNTTFGRKGKIYEVPELFYVLGALLGDGCIYIWKLTNNYTILVGDEFFAKKYAKMASICTKNKINAYIDRSHNVWFVKVNNYELAKLFKIVRTDTTYLKKIIIDKGKYSAKLFIEGFFDAEGCVKVVKEPTIRKTPKICLDFTNTNFAYLEIVKDMLKQYLNIDARYSIQYPNPNWRSNNKKIAYHLRIYKKEFVKIFFENINTIKLKKEKINYVKNWLELKRTL
jgi:hypothetical protein